MIEIFIVEGPRQGHCFELDRKTALIGRSSENDIQIDEPSVSRNHAKILKEKEKYYVEDLKSTNGTWINGNAIASGRKFHVEDGVPIVVGNVLISLGRECSIDESPKEFTIDILPSRADIRRRSLFRERRSRREENLQVIHNVCLTLLESLNLKEICLKILVSIFQVLKRIDSGHILLCEPGSEKFVEIAAHFKDATMRNELTYSPILAKRALEEGKAIMMPNTGMEAEGEVSRSVKKMGVKSVVCIPLISKTGTKGVMYLQSVNVTHGFRKDDLFFLTGLSAPVALAVENAGLYTRCKQAEIRLQRTHADLETTVKRRTAELEESKRRLEELSTTDALSGLHNYRYLFQSLESEFKRAVRYERSLSLLMIDIDYFKNFNDTFGHLCGDFVIKTVAHILKRNVRSTDVVARYGGDELAILLIETSTEMALEVAEKLRNEIAGYAFKWREKSLDVNVSVGLAAVPSPGIQNTHDLVNAADRALYQAKKAGRNSVIAAPFATDKD